MSYTPKKLFAFVGFSKYNMTDPSSIALENADLSEAPRFFFIRKSLECAQLQDKELCRLATSPDGAENQQAIAILETEAAGAQEKGPILSCWDRPHASYWMLRTQADSRAPIYTFEELFIAAVFCAAELQVSRQLKIPDLELIAFGLASSANKLITGWWQGRQLGLVRLLASAAKQWGFLYA